MKKVIITVINDLATDQRLHRICRTLAEQDYRVRVIGRKFTTSLPADKLYADTRRYSMIFKKGPLFYIFFNIRLFISLLFSKRPDLLLSIDLDTLLPNVLIRKIRKIPLVYDCHEYFTEVPELIGREKVKNAWKWIERKCIPAVDMAFTVSPAIATIYTEQFGKDFKLLRNLPERRPPVLDAGLKEKYAGKKLLIYQGALNIGRGIELMIQSMEFIEDAVLLIAGDGDIREELKAMVPALDLYEKVFFLGKLTPHELQKVTYQCDMGFSLEEDLGLSYRYALPNKLFDYIQAEIPFIYADLPEMRALSDEFGIGLLLKEREARSLAMQLRDFLSDKNRIEEEKHKLSEAAKVLNWEKEEGVLIKGVEDLMSKRK